MSIPQLINCLVQNKKAEFQQVYSQQRNTCGVTQQMFKLFCAQNLTKEDIDKFNIDQRDYTQKTLLFYAVIGNQDVANCESLDKLITQQDSFQSTALMYAAKFGHVEWVQYLVEDESCFKDQAGRSALMYCIGSLSDIKDEYVKYSNQDIETKLRIIDFLFSYEWYILDNNGKSCIDYLKNTKIDIPFIKYIEKKFIDKCIAYGCPKGILLDDRQYGLQVREKNMKRAENMNIKSIFQHVQQLQEEIVKWKQVVSKLMEKLQNEGESGLKQQIMQLQQDNKSIKNDIDERQSEFQTIIKEKDQKIAEYQNMIAMRDQEIATLRQQIQNHSMSLSNIKTQTIPTQNTKFTAGIQEQGVKNLQKLDISHQNDQSNIHAKPQYVDFMHPQITAPDSVVYEKVKALQNRLDRDTSYKHDAADVGQPKQQTNIPGTFKSPVSSQNALEEVAQRRAQYKNRIAGRLASLNMLESQ